jgi:hypothetical protein
MGVGPVIRELLWSMPNNKTLKELLVCCTQWAQLCLEKGKQSSAFPSGSFFLEEFKKVVDGKNKAHVKSFTTRIN